MGTIRMMPIRGPAFVVRLSVLSFTWASPNVYSQALRLRLDVLRMSFFLQLDPDT
jgi:hypothetical protein